MQVTPQDMSVHRDALFARLDSSAAAFEKQISSSMSSLYIPQDQALLDFLQDGGIPIPSIEEMEADLARTMDLPEIEKRLAVLKEEHEKNMENLINRQAWNYEQEQMDKYKAVEGALQQAGVNPEEETLETVLAFEDKLSEIYDDKFEAATTRLMHKWEADIIEERTAYEERVAPLLTQKERFEQAPTGTQPAIMFPFPQSVKDFNELNPAAKLRVAQFLQAQPTRAEQMAAEQNWKFEVNKLKSLYASDALFKSEVGSLVVQSRLAVADPRKR
ncbi:hypothetical protein BDZ89DRAFT_1165188 [Hymenopellis radicata]|nr:hypothetical protein BDZ89DRAFT_1165188 [Hymenopellis radicata]